MSWFKVDDRLHDHRKTRKVRRSHHKKARDVAPFGLWVLAGSWAGANSTAGFVPTEVLLEWDEDALELAERLVDAGLWWATEQDDEEGYGFHDFEEHNPVSEVDSGRYGNHLRWHVKRGITNDDCSYCTDDSSSSVGATRPDDHPDMGTSVGPTSSPDPTRPDPTPVRAKRATQLPDDWKPNDAHLAIAEERGISPSLELEKFRDWAKGNGATKKDWDATFRNWLRNARPTLSAVPDQPKRYTDPVEPPPVGLSAEQYAAWEREQRERAR